MIWLLMMFKPLSFFYIYAIIKTHILGVPPVLLGALLGLVSALYRDTAQVVFLLINFALLCCR